MTPAPDSPDSAGAPATPTRTTPVDAKKILTEVLKYTGLLAIAIAVIGGGLGYLFAGTEGLISALIGTALAVLFASITAASIIGAMRFDIAAFFGIVMGAWLLKIVVFIVILALLRDAPFVQTMVLFLTVIAGAVGTMLIDVIVVFKSRLGYASNVTLPSAPNETAR
ncbi:MULTISPECIES: hypothetical protein [Cryobacterium]|uniref:hypothetical protein n=1 Tax=Cryobacterium TaxID=69578 RepID=UPI000CD3B30A|nr:MULTISPECIES: hypothetical protein [Cryobacterium]POH69487.1 hypothetical protein C3B60_03240 [Cryobacterium zongtaii]TFC46013.1 hypothetical protein E3O57_07595 [Cryobacterium sp. TMN-39-2]